MKLLIYKLKKKGLIKKPSKDYKAISKIGAKRKNVSFSTEQFNEDVMSAQGASSETLTIVQGTGIYKLISGKTVIKSDSIDQIFKFTNINEIIWEAPCAEQQLWFINKYGVNVNFVNVKPSDIFELKSKRLGIQWKTITNNIPESLTKG
ncbi:MAG: hypothetical protein GY760_06365 [Deltaproteobacteria bacterium]|nr:hypothetical protein [Deltaproteobacteria bacterium]